MIDTVAIDRAKDHFGGLLEKEMERIEGLKAEGDFQDYGSLDTIVIGIIGGDGIGPAITAVGRQVLESLLADQVTAGKVEFREIEGLTIENRVEHLQPIPDDVLEAINSAT